MMQILLFFLSVFFLLQKIGEFGFLMDGPYLLPANQDTGKVSQGFRMAIMCFFFPYCQTASTVFFEGAQAGQGPES